MKINKTRIGKLKSGLEQILGVDSNKIEDIIKLVNQYEKNNLDTIENLKRGKTVEMNKINGALKQTIHSHGPITMVLIGSASKRIWGALLDNHTVEPKTTIFQKIMKWIRK
jgi:hypothetical protein